MCFVPKTKTFSKLFIAVSFSGLFMYAVLAFYSFHSALSDFTKMDVTQKQLKLFPNLNPIIEKERFVKDLKYILIWTNPGNKNIDLELGQQMFLDYKCPHVNCFITMTKMFFTEGYNHYDAIVFNMSRINNWQKKYLPITRLPDQIYVFHSMMPADEHPICNEYLDNYFNWTWSYKLYSDIVTPFIVVKDENDNIIAPEPEMEWPAIWEKRSNITLPKNKKPKALLMINENCKQNFRKSAILRKLQFVMKQHGLVFDIFGCSNNTCPKQGCSQIKYEDYYFYLVFEKSTSEDYVTQLISRAFNNGLVPILLNGPDYNNFLPPGSYMDARHMTPEKLAAIIDYTILNQFTYNSYFYWKKYYTVHRLDTKTGYCELCRLLNKQSVNRTYTVYEHFRKWWYYGPLKDRCYPKGSVNESEITSYLDTTPSRKPVSV